MIYLLLIFAVAAVLAASHSPRKAAESPYLLRMGPFHHLFVERGVATNQKA
jgi:hypothetical protein